MEKLAFDNDKYLKMQSDKINERIKKFGHKLYLEFGGKLFDDYHASRVLPGFKPDSKMSMLMTLKDKVEVLIVINADDIQKNKLRADLGITYDQDVFRLIDILTSYGLYVSSIVLTQFEKQPNAIVFKKKCEKLGLKVAKHYKIPGYPTNTDLIVSEEGLGKNEYIETTKELVVVTAPGPGSGKMATCLSQLYHDHKRGIKAGYTKYETFPVWNLPLKHPVNMAYEAATADLNDVNMIDPYHLEKYGITSVNYNRDIEIFPVLNTLFKRIMDKSPYYSPTDMGVNMIGYCIIDDEIAKQSAKQEIIRRYYDALVGVRKDIVSEQVSMEIELLMRNLELTIHDRKVVDVANSIASSTKRPCVAIELADGTIITGKTTELLGASCSALLNALKYLADIDDEVLLITPDVINPVQNVKTDILNSNNPHLHLDEALITLAISAVHDEKAAKALSHIKELKNAQAHSSVILSDSDVKTFKNLGIHLTQEPHYENKKYYHGK